MIITELIRKYFNLDKPPCESCETLQKQLEIANYEKKQLLDTILSFHKPVVEERATQAVEIEPIRPKTVTWAVQRQMLEAEDRAKAETLRKKQLEIEELEKQVGLTNVK